MLNECQKWPERTWDFSGQCWHNHKKTPACLLNSVYSKCILRLFYIDSQVAENIPLFIHLLRRNESPLLTIRKLQTLVSPQFSEQGTNQRKFEGEVYSDFIKYLREVASKYILTVVYAWRHTPHPSYVNKLEAWSTIDTVILCVLKCRRVYFHWDR